MTKVVGIVARSLGLNPEGLRFNFVSDEDDTKEVLEIADKMKQLGMAIDLEKMRKYIKYDIISDKEKTIWTPTTEESDNNEKPDDAQVENK